MGGAILGSPNSEDLNPEPQIWHLEVTLRSPYVGKLPIWFWI